MHRQLRRRSNARALLGKRNDGSTRLNHEPIVAVTLADNAHSRLWSLEAIIVTCAALLELTRRFVIGLEAEEVD
jgi:hypothetical protein